VDNEPQISQVQLCDDGFIWRQSDGTSGRVAWAEVDSIFTYKTDCFTWDNIWLAFEVESYDVAVSISEETEGFGELMKAINKHFPEIDADWYLRVMQPPFEENLTLLFEKPMPPTDSL
jgi:hypothetical protein